MCPNIVTAPLLVPTLFTHLSPETVKVLNDKGSAQVHSHVPHNGSSQQYPADLFVTFSTRKAFSGLKLVTSNMPSLYC